jgi:phage protein D
MTNILNKLPIISTSRNPRSIVSIGGIQMKWINWEINNNGFYAADTFEITLPISAQPQGIDLSWWAQQTSLEAAVYAGFPNDPTEYSITDLDLLILGRVDDLTINPVERTIKVSGRDYTSMFIDTKSSLTLLHKTASQIATALAKSHGLTPVVTPTHGWVGTYYEINHFKLTNRTSEWNLLSYLAQEEAYQIYVKGKELHFEPAPDEDNPSSVYQLQWDDITNIYPTFNGLQLSFSRNLTIAKDVIVHVHSWNNKQKKGFTRKAEYTHTQDKVLKGSVTKASVVRTPQIYSKTIPNLFPDAAQKKADSILRTISQHEMKLYAFLPADDLLTPQVTLRVKGTGAYDQDYYADSIIRRMSMEWGYTMEINAKNHNVNSVVSPTT